MPTDTRRDSDIGFTAEEDELRDMIAEVFNRFESLPREHPSELDEFAHHIHIIQRMVMVRPVRRKLRETD